MKLLFVLFLFIFIPFAGSTQILNIEQYRTGRDTSKALIGNFDFSLALNKNQQTLLNFTTTGHLGYFSDQHFYLFITNISLLQYEGNRLFNDGYFHLRGNFLNSKKISPELFSQYQYDRNRGMLGRVLIGAGGRFRIFEGEKFKMYFGTGAMNEYEEWKQEGLPVIRRNLIKSSSYLSFFLKISETTSFSTITYYQVSPKYLEASRVFLDNRLAVGITKVVSLSISFTGAYDHRPVIDIAPWTYELLTGVGFKW